MSGDGSDTYPEWDMKHGWMERTDNGSLLLCDDVGNAVVLEIVDRFGQQIYPDPVATAMSQAQIDDRLKHYKTRRLLDFDLDDAVEWTPQGDSYCECRYPGPWKTHPDGYGVCDGCGKPHE